VSRLFLLFLIASLPFRGWAVERMEFQMNTGMSDECALHMQEANDIQGAASAHDSPYKGCQSCQLCMALAALDTPAAFALMAIQQCAPTPCTTDFASAEPARHAKPPIS
jgi:hypothetical protein